MLMIAKALSTLTRLAKRLIQPSLPPVVTQYQLPTMLSSSETPVTLQPQVFPSVQPSTLALIRKFEGLRLQSYQDVAGVWTIGYGSTGPDVGPGMTWTTDQAVARLAQDVAKFATEVRLAVAVDLTQPQYDALVSFVYNVGATAFRKSTLLQMLNQAQYLNAADQFTRWNKAGGKVVAGLVTRRAAERDLFRTGTFGVHT